MGLPLPLLSSSFHAISLQASVEDDLIFRRDHFAPPKVRNLDWPDAGIPCDLCCLANSGREIS